MGVESVTVSNSPLSFGKINVGKRAGLGASIPKSLKIPLFLNVSCGLPQIT